MEDFKEEAERLSLGFKIKSIIKDGKITFIIVLGVLVLTIAGLYQSLQTKHDIEAISQIMEKWDVSLNQ